MRVEWDEAKRKANLRKHGVEFADALSVLDDPRAVTIEDRDHDEQRFVTLGLDAFGNLRCWSTPTGGRTRYASSRPARPNPTNAANMRNSP